MKLRKRIFSLLMMLCMIVTLMPTSFAATEIESGTLNYVWNFADANETVINDMTVTLNFCNSEQEVTGGVMFAQSTSGYGVSEVTYAGDKFVYEGQEYLYIRLDFALPEGYVINTQDGVQITNSVSFMNVATLKEIQNVKVHTKVDKVTTDTITTKDLYIKFVDSLTKEVYTPTGIGQSYFYNPNTNSTLAVAPNITEVEAGLYKVTIDSAICSGYNFCGLFYLGTGHKFVESEFVTMQGIVADVDKWFASGETIIAEIDSSGASTITKTCGFLKNDLSVLEGVNFTISLSNGETDTQKVQIAKFTGGKGSFNVQCLNNGFYYNGQTYSTLECSYVLPEGYVTGWPLSSEGTHYYTYSENFVNVVMDSMHVDEKPEVNTEILVKFMHGNAVLNTPCKNNDAQSVGLGSQEYTITVDEEDIIVYDSSQMYLVTTIGEMFPEGLPEAPDHEVAGKFLGWYGAHKTNGNTENTIENYCYQPDDEIKIPIDTTDNSISFTAVYDRIISAYKVSYIDEVGNEISNQFYMTYVDFPKTFGEKLEQALDVVETFGLKHVGSFGEISTNVTAMYPEDMYPSFLVPYGAVVGVKYTYEYNRSDTTFDKTNYTFMLEDGTVVDGVKVKVRLTNSTDASKVTIETSTSGHGYCVIEHKDDVIYYGGDTYSGIEVEYEFPEGYVLKDTDISGTTVWYKATDWCAGGGIFWILEKLPEEAVVPEQEPEVEIIIPDADAPAEEEVKVEIPEEKPVVSEDKMDDIIEANKKHPVKIETNDDVLIIFPIGGMDKVDGKTEYDFGVRIEKDYDKAHDNGNHYGQMKNPKFEKDEFVLRINYNYSGQLPGQAEITIPVGKAWAGKTLYYYQVLEDGTYEYTGQSAVVDEKGHFTIKQDHCSDYVIVTAAPTSSLLYYLYSENPSYAASYTSPKTGENNMLVYLLMLAATGVVVTTAMRRKAK